jgi:hypothetical protein
MYCSEAAMDPVRSLYLMVVGMMWRGVNERLEDYLAACLARFGG